MRYAFPATFSIDKVDTTFYNVVFPDIIGALTCGEGFDDAMYMAKDCLKCVLTLEHIRHIKPSTVEEVKRTFPDKEVYMIEVDV